MAIPSHRLALLRDEYETTDISIEDLCVYHQVQPSDLKGYTKWQKRLSPNLNNDLLVSAFLEPDDNPMVEVIEVEPNLPPVIPQPSVPTVVDSSEDIDPIDISEIKTRITNCKRLAIEKCEDFLTNDAKYAEVKEIKDIVSIVNDIDKSMTAVKAGPGSSVTVLINNLIANFRDDC